MRVRKYEEIIIIGLEFWRIGFYNNRGIFEKRISRVKLKKYSLKLDWRIVIGNWTALLDKETKSVASPYRFVAYQRFRFLIIIEL